MILDSNILIYAIQPNYEYLIDWILKELPSVSVISQIEVLGYHKLSQQQKKQFEVLFDNLTILSINTAISNRAIALKQQQKMSLGDSLIAATALEYNLPLITRNTQDFQWIGALSVINPIKP
ncbi:MAG: type II toxin-antitoxin system VapC family toxin [Moraxellaceae bacterium]|nr:type II toxin-antitoxin system VapC family toxin [Moraxellaceae bacterium]